MPLNEPTFLCQTSIVWNPLIIPDRELLRATKVRKWFLRAPEVHFSDSHFHLAESQSIVWTWSAYDFFSELSSHEWIWVGEHLQDALLRIIPSWDLELEEDSRAFMLWEDVIEDALDLQILREVTYEDAIMYIVDVLAEWRSEEGAAFEDAFSTPVDIFRQALYDAKKSENTVLQVTEKGQWRIIAFPRNYFDDEGKDDTWKEKWFNIGDILTWILWWPEPSMA